MKAMKAEDIQRAFDDLMQEIGYDKVERLQRSKNAQNKDCMIENCTVNVSNNLKNTSEDCRVDFIHSDRAAYFKETLCEYVKTTNVTKMNYNQAIILTTPDQGEQQFLNGTAEARWRLIKRIGYPAMYQSGYYIWTCAMAYANNIQNMVSHQEHGVQQPSPYYRMFGIPMEYKHFFPFASPIIANISDEDIRKGKRLNHVGIAVNFASLRHPYTKTILSFDYTDSNNNIQNCYIKQTDSQNIKIDKWANVRKVVADKVLEAEFRDNSFHKMKEKQKAEQELNEIQHPDDVLLYDHLKTINANSLYKDWKAPTKKQYLREEIQKINLQLNEPIDITPQQMNTGTVPFYENILRKCQQKLTKELQDSRNKEDSQNVEYNIGTFAITKDPSLSLDSHMDDSNLIILSPTMIDDNYPNEPSNSEKSHEFLVSAVVESQTATDEFRKKRLLSEVPQNEKDKAEEKEFNKLLDTGTLVEISQEERTGPNGPNKNNTVRAFATLIVQDDDTCKARIVAMGNRQPSETYSVTSYGQMSKISLRVILLTGLLRGIIPKQADISSAFLTEDYKKLLYVKYRKNVYKMKKYLYGLKESGFMFYKKLSKLLTDKSIGFKQLTKEDPCVFIRREKDGFLSILGVLTDDLLFLMKDDKIAEVVKKLEKAGLKIPHVKEVHKFNGLEIQFTQDALQLSINQSVLIKQTISDLEHKLGYQLQEYDTIPNAYFHLEDKMIDVDKKFYQSLVGSLNWISQMSRPDITHVVASAATVNKCPKQDHLDILLQLFGYLKKTAGRAMTYRRPEDGVPEITIFTDSDWMSKGVDYDILSHHMETNIKSQSGILIMFNETPIYWNSKKQDCPAQSACAAEIIAASTAYDTAFPILSLLNTFGYSLSRTLHFIDNESAIKTITNDKMNKVLAAMKRRYGNIKYLIEQLISFPIYVGTKHNIADYLTKPRDKLKMSTEAFNQNINLIFGDHFTSKKDFMKHIKSLCSDAAFAKIPWADYYNITNYDQLIVKRKEDLEAGYQIYE